MPEARHRNAAFIGQQAIAVAVHLSVARALGALSLLDAVLVSWIALYPLDPPHLVVGALQLALEHVGVSWQLLDDLDAHCIARHLPLRALDQVDPLWIAVLLSCP